MSISEHKHILLFGGSFNPIHIGHLQLAHYALHLPEVDEVSFLVSPQNPLKKASNLPAADHRLAMTRLALQTETSGLTVNDIEFMLPQPSYTWYTLQVLHQHFPQIRFSLLIGSDNWFYLYRWKNVEKIMANTKFYVYPRVGFTFDPYRYPQVDVQALDAPLYDISATQIRALLHEGKDASMYLPSVVQAYIQQHRLYT